MAEKGPPKTPHHRTPTPQKSSPYAGPVTCLRCDHEFQSWDRRQNRLCQNCREAIDRESSEETSYSFRLPGRRPRNRDDG
jgi:predicted amidophosphoribosyltransferase